MQKNGGSGILGAVCWFLLTVPLVAATEEGKPDATRSARAFEGRVLDVFDDGSILISFGAKDGARKGLEVGLHRSQPKPAVGIVELIEVGSRHSIGRLKTRFVRPREDDLVFGYSDEQLVIPESARTPFLWQRGGAIIDLATPKENE
jgi:hypothetical protein